MNFAMWHPTLSLFLIISVALSVVSAHPSQPRSSATPDLKFTCPSTLSHSLCCSHDIQQNGAVEGCQESRHIMLSQATEEKNATFVQKCTTSQITGDYDTPVCCNKKVQTFRVEKGETVFSGVNCMDAEDVSVGLERRRPSDDSEEASKTVDSEDWYKRSPFDYRADELAPTATVPLMIPEASKLMDKAREEPVIHSYEVNEREPRLRSAVKTPTPAWRLRETKRLPRRNVKKAVRASNTRNSVANTIINDLNSASSRAIVRNAAPKPRAHARSHVAGKASAKKQERQLGGLGGSSGSSASNSTSSSGLGGLGSLTGLLSGLGGLKVRQLGGLGGSSGSSASNSSSSSGLGGLSSLTGLLSGLGGLKARQLGGLGGLGGSSGSSASNSTSSSGLGGLSSLTGLLSGLGGLKVRAQDGTEAVAATRNQERQLGGGLGGLTGLLGGLGGGSESNSTLVRRASREGGAKRRGEEAKVVAPGA